MFKEELNLVPHLPGSYQMYNKDNVIIYVGKAKDLRNRLSNYFIGKNTGKTEIMVSEIDHFEYIVTNSELEAFILELNLIKKYNPRYNILLKDDKSYPYIEYTRKPYPSLKVVRYLNIKNHKDKLLFGPFVNVYAARRIVNLINRLYPLKKCDHLEKNVCLYYHIGECLGYCIKNIDKDKLDLMEKDIIKFLKGNEEVITNKLMEKIEFYSEQLNYEKARDLKKDLEYIKVVMEKQRVELHDNIDRDIINYYFDNGYLSIEIFYLRNGKLIGHNNKIIPVMEDYISELEYFIVLYYNKHEIPKEILINDNINIEILKGSINQNFKIDIYNNEKILLDTIEINNDTKKYIKTINNTSSGIYFVINSETNTNYDNYDIKISITNTEDSKESISKRINLDEPLKCIDSKCDYIDLINNKIVRYIKNNQVLKEPSEMYINSTNLTDLVDKDILATDGTKNNTLEISYNN